MAEIMIAESSDEVKFKVESMVSLSFLIGMLIAGGWEDQWSDHKKKILVFVGDDRCVVATFGDQTTPVNFDFVQKPVKNLDFVTAFVTMPGMLEKGDLVTTAFTTKKNKRVVLQWKIDE